MAYRASDRRLSTANQLLRSGQLDQALQLYGELKEEQPELSRVLETNIELAILRKRREKRKSGAIRKKAYQPDAEKYLLSYEIYTVDIVVPIYNALEEVKRCLHSVIKWSDPYDFQLIIVNDGSTSEVTEWLNHFEADHDRCRVIHNTVNLGYTKSVNIGFKAARADYVIALNSDTVVTPKWIQSLLRCARARANIGIVGPLSNAASWQNIPDLFNVDKQFAVNEVPAGFTIPSFAEYVYENSLRKYPEVPFVNGFCFLVARDVIDAIGYFDEESFPTGYGEENDYCIRASKAGFKLAIADDAYVYHAKSASFGHDARKQLAKAGMTELKRKHGPEFVNNLAQSIRKSKSLGGVRDHVRGTLERKKSKVSPSNTAITSLRIAFLLPVSGGGGGVHSIVQECLGMQRVGATANVLVPKKHLANFLKAYDDIEQKNSLFIGFEPSDLFKICSGFDVVIGTIYTSLKALAKVVEEQPQIIPGYYIQDYEPLFSAPWSKEWIEARESYTLIPKCILFAKTKWICDKVEDEHGVKVRKVRPSLDHNVYHLNLSRHFAPEDQAPIIVSAMIRPKTPRRGAFRTMSLLKRLKEALADKVDIRIFGCEGGDPEFSKLPSDFAHTNHGVLTRPEVSEVLKVSDWFIDLSDYQAFGRTGIEALACGSRAIITRWGGADEYAAVDGWGDCVYLVDVFSHDLFECVCDLIARKDGGLVKAIKSSLIANKFTIEAAALSELQVFLEGFSTCIDRVYSQ